MLCCSTLNALHSCVGMHIRKFCQCLIQHKFMYEISNSWHSDITIVWSCYDVSAEMFVCVQSFPIQMTPESQRYTTTNFTESPQLPHTLSTVCFHSKLLHTHILSCLTKLTHLILNFAYDISIFFLKSSVIFRQW